MDLTEIHNVSGPLATVLRISSMLGLVPLRISPVNNQTIRVSPLRVHKDSGQFGYSASISRKRAIFGYVLVSLLLLLELLSIALVDVTFQIETLSRIRTKMSLVFSALVEILSFISIIIAAFDGINKVKRLISYSNKLEEINNELESSPLHLKIKNSGIIIWGYLSTILIIILWSGYFCIEDALATNASIIQILFTFMIEFGFWYQFIFKVLLCMQFVFIVCSVNVTLQSQNERLRRLIFKMKLCDSMKSKTMTIAYNAHFHNRHAVSLIQRLCCANVSICELLRSIDKGEGALVATLLLHIIVDYEWSYDKILKFTLITITAFYEAALLIVMVEPCHKTQEEFQATRILVSQLMCAPAEREFRDELSHYYNHFIEDPPAFSPLGLFVLTRQFLIAVIGGVATFLVIILQFNLTDTINLQYL